MPRKKTAKNVPLSPWLSAHTDCREGRFIQVGNSLLLADAFHNLNSGARFLYLCLAMEAGGKPGVKFSRSTAKKYGIPTTTFERAIKQLRDAGFIELQEDENMFQYAANVYRFSSRWKSNSAPHFGVGKK